MYHIFKLMNIRNRAYVIDRKGNKLFFGTEYQCKKFIKYMKEGDPDVEGGREMVESRKAGSQSLV